MANIVNKASDSREFSCTAESMEADLANLRNAIAERHLQFIRHQWKRVSGAFRTAFYALLTGGISIGGCNKSDPSHTQTVRAPENASSEKHSEEQQKIWFESEEPREWQASGEAIERLRADNHVPDLEVPEGFECRDMAPKELIGSPINLTFDMEGNPLVSPGESDPPLPDERGPRTLYDRDNDGIYDTARELTKMLANCQGLLAYDETTYYVVGRGPGGMGLYRLKDENRDHAAEQIELILHFDTSGLPEHIPHAVTLGPDGFLYLITGDAGHAEKQERETGSIWRIDPRTGEAERIVTGLRNPFDLAFHEEKLFTCDANMEFDINLPWERPVQVYHCPPGADFGWTKGRDVWPPYFIDTLPPISIFGHDSSPTGIEACEHEAFPKFYQARFFADWQRGCIYAARFARKGASFDATWEMFATGRSFNVTDLAFGKDSLGLTTGGRETQGKLIYIRPKQGRAEETQQTKQSPQSRVGKDAVRAALHQSQPQSAWGRSAIREFQKQAGEHWVTELQSIALDTTIPEEERFRALSLLMQSSSEHTIDFLALARTLANDTDPEMRAHAASLFARCSAHVSTNDLIALLGDNAPVVQRHALEAVRQRGIKPSLADLHPLLASRDRFVRSAAILVLGTLDAAMWHREMLQHEDPRIVIAGFVALNKTGLVADDPLVEGMTFQRELDLLMDENLSSENLLDLLRCIELNLLSIPLEKERLESKERVQKIGARLLQQFPTGKRSHDYEIARILAMIRPEGCIEKLVSALEQCNPSDAESRRESIHYFQCLSYVPLGWTDDLFDRMLGWYEKTKNWNGGKDFHDHLQSFHARMINPLNLHHAQLTPEQETHFSSKKHQNQVEQHLISEGDSFFLKPPLLTEEQLRLLCEGEGPDRDHAIMALAKRHPNIENQKIFIGAIAAHRPSVVKAALQALRGISDTTSSERKQERGPTPSKQAALRELVEAFSKESSQIEQAERPRQPELAPRAQEQMSEAEIQKLLNELQEIKGESKNGRGVFEKYCAGCHTVGETGASVGPNLTGVSGRFSPEDLLRKLANPQGNIDDKYGALQIATTDGRMYIGIGQPDDSSPSVALTVYNPETGGMQTIHIPRGEIDEIKRGGTIMPGGFLQILTPTQIADLFAFLGDQKKSYALPLPYRSEK